jgi:hypothetical protein
LLRGSAISTPTGPFNLLLVRVWPKISEERTGNAPASGNVASGWGGPLG